MTTTINTGHPLMNTNDERMRIRAALRHLGSGADLRDFPATASEKVALVKTASQRKLVAWNKGRGRYELTPAGWYELAPSRRFGVGSMLLGSAAGATIGAVALAVFWVMSGASHEAGLRTAAAPPAVSKKVASLSAPAVTGAIASPGSPASDPVAVQTASPAPAVPAVEPAREAAPAAAPAPVAEPTNVAEQPTPEQLAEAAAKAKQVAAKKARQRAAAARRRREDAARAWAAAEPTGTRQAEYSGYGGFGGYGGRGSWFAFR